MAITLTEGPIITNHAKQRAQARGVQMEAVVLAAIFGKRTRANSGKVTRTLGLKEVKKIQQSQLASTNVIDRLRGVSVVTTDADDGVVVVTVMARNSK